MCAKHKTRFPLQEREIHKKIVNRISWEKENFFSNKIMKESNMKSTKKLYTNSRFCGKYSTEAPDRIERRNNLHEIYFYYIFFCLPFTWTKHETFSILALVSWISQTFDLLWTRNKWIPSWNTWVYPEKFEGNFCCSGN